VICVPAHSQPLRRKRGAEASIRRRTEKAARLRPAINAGRPYAIKIRLTPTPDRAAASPAAVSWLLLTAAVRSVTMPWALHSVMSGLAAMSRGRAPRSGGDAQQHPGVAGQEAPARHPLRADHYFQKSIASF
jgi:hypothetical protein